MNRKKHIIALAAALLVLFVSWMVWGNVTVGVTRYTVPSGRLPAAFDGFAVAVVSDLHNADFGDGNRTIAEKIAEAEPDMIAITGDLVDANRTDPRPALALIDRLTGLAPCYYVTGNHEESVWPQYLELERQMIDRGVTVLRDHALTLSRDGASIRIAGLDDPSFAGGRSDDQAQFLQTHLHDLNIAEDYCVLLSHRPEAFAVYVSEGADLVLSGHAHGGQFRLPLLGGLVAPNQGLFPKYDAGAYTEGETTMIVSRGLGNSVIPVRFNNRPEIVVVELKSE